MTTYKRNTNKIKLNRKRFLKKHRALFYIGSVSFFVVVCILVVFGINLICQKVADNKNTEISDKISRPQLNVELLTVNEYSRPGVAVDKMKGIVIHYTANPGSTAMQNRNYFEGLKDSKTTKVSSHFVVGLDGEIVQCIPCSEIAYASNDRNDDTISIECCHVDKNGKFNRKTYNSLVHLTAWLCQEFEIDPDNVIRHYDVTGKACPKYYVDNPNEWKKFIKDVKRYGDK